AIMGGMLTSTLLTLMVVPVGYSIVVGRLDRWSARRAEKKAAKEAAELAAEEDDRSTPSTGTVQPAGD
ncbi:MAG: hypothetical protein KDE23_28040, partial [Caldilinea sp.]|nr:hypothetical protein [Caldilinea sp.]